MKTHSTYDMRFTGSLWTTVCQPLARSVRPTGADEGEGWELTLTSYRLVAAVRPAPFRRSRYRWCMSTALLTDMYELTMVDSAIASGTAGRRSVFEVFARRLPGERRYGVVAGTGRVVEAIRDFRFGPEEIAYLESAGIVSERTLAWMEGYRFTGDVYGYAEGECYFPYSPVLTVLGHFE